MVTNRGLEPRTFRVDSVVATDWELEPRTANSDTVVATDRGL